jgi:ABC-type multidrug transport system permease subunit
MRPDTALAGHARAVAASFRQQWKGEMMRPALIYCPFMQVLGPAIGVAWIVGHSGAEMARAYALVGAALMQVWMWTVHRTGWSISNEHSLGTLELMMTTRTPLPVVMFGKSLAIIAFMAFPGLMTFGIVAFASGGLPPIGQPVAFVASILLAMVTVVATSFIFAPVSYLLGARGGFFNGIMPLGAAISGFLYPTGLLPPALQALAHALPTSWAMDAVVRTQTQTAFEPAVLVDWGLAAALTALSFAFALWMFRTVELRVRVLGNLGQSA